MKALDNLKVIVKMMGGFGLLTLLLIAVAALGYVQMGRIQNNLESIYTDRLLPIAYLGKAESSLYKMRGDVYKYLLIKEERADTQQAMAEDVRQADEAMKLYRATYLLEKEKAELEKFDRAWAEYQSAVAQVVRDADAGNEQAAYQSLLDGGAASNARKAVGGAAQALVEINRQEAERLKAEADAAFDAAARLMLIFAVAAVIAAAGMGVLITNSINTPLKIMSGALQNLAQGDLNRDVPQAVKDTICARKDEVGLAGRGLAAAENYLLQMAALADQIADGNLAVSVQPKCAKDELGIAFERMVSGLRGICAQVKDSAAHLGAASTQLSAAAAQAGSATGQIVTTLTQVATGVSQQSEATSRTAASVEQMSRAIDGVSRGAQEQASAAAKASEITTRMSGAIQRVAGSAQEVTERSAEAAKAARQGTATVEQTLEGMGRIKARVGESAQKVKEMGERSQEIGAIVETIEDIASQTNLLALNAAIEAARAGEHGKGFAVVADEVRKLAERAANATKEIGGLIRGIQGTVAEAVGAMESGTKEVETGVSLANEAGAALSAILEAAESVYEQAKQAADAAEEMMKASGELVNAVDSVSAVIEENTAATEQMSASSSEVTQAVESIASVSEENSAAIEEVSAATEEMNSQVEEVSSAAEELAEMAQELKIAVARFKLSQEQDLSDQVETFKQAHVSWVARLRKMLAGRLHLKDEEVASHTECDLGKWYYGVGKKEFGGLPQFQAVETPHARLHQLCRQAVASFNSGDRAAAERIVGQIEPLSHEVVADLDSLERAIRSNGGNGHRRPA